MNKKCVANVGRSINPLKELDGEDSWTDNDLEIPIPVAALI